MLSEVDSTMALTISSAFYEDLGFPEFRGIISEDVLNPGTPKSAHVNRQGSLSQTVHDLDPNPRSDSASLTNNCAARDSDLWNLRADVVQSKVLRDRLVQLYFQHVSPLCPVIDNEDFYSLYSTYRGDQAFFRRFSSGVFAAMMFAAIQVSAPISSRYCPLLRSLFAT
jgi:hypothetical protein